MGISKPIDIAEFALFLASDKSKSMTGGIHVVDSGYTSFKGKLELSCAANDPIKELIGSRVKY